MTVIPMNCMHCFSYDKEKHKCSKFDLDVSNCATCTKWLPKLVFTGRSDLILEEYKQYDLGDLTDIYNKRWLREMTVV